MSDISTDKLRSPFFPNSTPLDKPSSSGRARSLKIQRNDLGRKNELDSLSKDHARVKIDSKTKDFARIKRAVDTSAPLDREDYLNNLKFKIQNGEYEIDPEKLAEKMILSEF